MLVNITATLHGCFWWLWIAEFLLPEPDNLFFDELAVFGRIPFLGCGIGKGGFDGNSAPNAARCKNARQNDNSTNNMFHDTPMVTVPYPKPRKK